MPHVDVRAAREEEAAACLALLPEACALSPELLIARQAGALVGAAAVMWRSWSSPGGFPVSVHVLPDARRRGVGRALLAAASALADGEADGLWALRHLDEGDEAAAFLRACGFTAIRREHHFQARVEALLAVVRPMLDRLRARPGFPADAAIRPVAEAPMEEISWLVTREFGGAPVEMLHRMQRRLREMTIEDDRSFAVMQGERLAGVLLWRLADGVAVIDARVVVPGDRNGWTNLVLLEAGLLRIRAEGIEEFRFHCEDTIRDTMRLAQRCAATERSRTALFYQAFAAA